MAKLAVTRETVFALRREIARIEGILPERFETPDGRDATVIRRGGMAVDPLLRSGIRRLDETLGGGLPKAALTEIHGGQTRDAGCVAGFALALLSLLLKTSPPEAPVLWAGTSEIFSEAGFPYAGGLRAFFGIDPEALLFSEVPKIQDALWVAEEAARLKALSAVVLEIRGNPERLDLTATRRLHHRAQDSGRPVFLLRQAALAEPTAAPCRLVVSPASAAARQTIIGPLAGSIGRPAFTVAVSKSRTALPGQFTLEWNPDERAFEERRSEERTGEKQRTENPVTLVPASFGRADPAAATGTVLAFQTGPAQAPRHQPSRQERPTHRRSRRTG
ncbi:protein ImuA [Mesorhizobium sp. J18]|uniref:ImuA family protein n=1 Tax=Mesorhizobium sp. J18 TaxID=935263 RepID=UPI00119BD367|nr:hypothetical protein [Mesorhizobium sp. J18]TWG97895.1 protein ImuA [Mesorhizobium sp. J18]